MTSIRPFVLSIVAVLFGVATVLVSTETYARTWKTEKFSVEGDFDSLQDNGTKVRIKRSDGKFVRVDLNKLSEDDRLYIEQNYTNSDFEEEPEESDFEEENEPAPSIIPSVPKEDNSVENLIKTVNLLEKKGEYLVARQKILLALQDEFSEKLVDLWIQLDSNLCPNSNNYKRTITVFTPEERSWKEYILQLHGYNKWDMLNPINSWLGKISEDEAKKIQKERFDKEVSKDFGTLDKENISRTLEIYETLKKSTDSLLTYLKSEMLQTKDVSLLNTLTNYSSKVNSFKNSVKAQRTIFLSYNVVSPYLANAERWRYLANEQKEWKGWDKLFQPKKENLDMAVEMISFSCHHKHLSECSEDVAKQFIELQENLKSMISKEKYESLKVHSTFMDSSDPSKKIGADAWWE